MNLDYDLKLHCTKKELKIKYIEDTKIPSDAVIEYYDKYKLSILLTDNLAAVTNDKVLNTGKYSILFFRPDEIHFGRFLKSGIYSYIDFYIPKNYFQEIFGNNHALTFFMDTSSERVNYIVPNEREKVYIQNIVDLSINAIKSKNRIELFSCMLDIVNMCNRLYNQQKENPIKDNVPYGVSKTLIYISEHYNEKLSLKMLSENVGCSVAYLSRRFREFTGKTVYNYITDIRIRNAQFFLKNGHNVTETCFLCGFDDCSNFIKTFKRLSRKTPKEFQKFD